MRSRYGPDIPCQRWPGVGAAGAISTPVPRVTPPPEDTPFPGNQTNPCPNRHLIFESAASCRGAAPQQAPAVCRRHAFAPLP
eukprot:222465-Chlamydomonas_euryale.AAC.1